MGTVCSDSDQAIGFEIATEPWNPARRQKEGTADHIVQYAGIQAAFFFHLFNTFTRPDQLNRLITTCCPTCCITTFLYKLHYNILQHIRTFYKILQDIPTYSSCQLFEAKYSTLQVDLWSCCPQRNQLRSTAIPMGGQTPGPTVGQREKEEGWRKNTETCHVCVWVYMFIKFQDGSIMFNPI